MRNALDNAQLSVAITVLMTGVDVMNARDTDPQTQTKLKTKNREQCNILYSQFKSANELREFIDKNNEPNTFAKTIVSSICQYFDKYCEMRKEVNDLDQLLNQKVVDNNQAKIILKRVLGVGDAKGRIITGQSNFDDILKNSEKHLELQERMIDLLAKDQSNMPYLRIMLMRFVLQANDAGQIPINNADITVRHFINAGVNPHDFTIDVNTASPADMLILAYPIPLQDLLNSWYERFSHDLTYKETNKQGVNTSLEDLRKNKELCRKMVVELGRSTFNADPDNPELLMYRLIAMQKNYHENISSSESKDVSAKIDAIQKKLLNIVGYDVKAVSPLLEKAKEKHFKHLLNDERTNKAISKFLNSAEAHLLQAIHVKQPIAKLKSVSSRFFRQPAPVMSSNISTAIKLSLFDCETSTAYKLPKGVRSMIECLRKNASSDDAAVLAKLKTIVEDRPETNLKNRDPKVQDLYNAVKSAKTLDEVHDFVNGLDIKSTLRHRS